MSKFAILCGTESLVQHVLEITYKNSQDTLQKV